MDPSQDNVIPFIKPYRLYSQYTAKGVRSAYIYVHAYTSSTFHGFLTFFPLLKSDDDGDGVKNKRQLKTQRVCSNYEANVGAVQASRIYYTCEC